VDIPLLVEHFVARFNRLQQKDIVGVSEQAMSMLLRYDYPGNIRELANIIEHAFVLCPAGLIEPQHLPVGLAGIPDATSGSAGASSTLKGLEAAYIADLLRRHQDNRAAAAREMGVHPSTLFRKIKALGIAGRSVPRQDHGQTRAGKRSL
jgi:transcriptional regulator with PAS, ATPase and Fis domain